LVQAAVVPVVEKAVVAAVAVRQGQRLTVLILVNTQQWLT
jgi:hypothetical protein